MTHRPIDVRSTKTRLWIRAWRAAEFLETSENGWGQYVAFTKGRGDSAVTVIA